MPHATYLIAGSSHAALEALRSIRNWDAQGSIAMVTRDAHLPYSPTVLPYVVSGQSDPVKVTLRAEAEFKTLDATLVRGDGVAALDTAAKRATLASGAVWTYDKFLIATGASPAIPPIPGLSDVPFHVLRTMEDATGLRDAISKAKTAVVLGAGLIGMHAAENLAHAGAKVTIVEMRDQVLPGYFDAEAAAMIEAAFTEHGVTLRMGTKVVGVAKNAGGITVSTDKGEAVTADLLLVATGVRPNVDFLDGSGVEVDQGVLVDDAMATGAADVWAAGDVAQARDFYGQGKVMTGILPDAVEQGRIAGMAMAGDPGVKPYPGGVPINTYTFFGRQAISVGLCQPGDGMTVTAPGNGGGFGKIVFDGDRLAGISTIDAPMDPGIMWQLITRRTDLGPVRDRFVAEPLATGRALMSSIWR